MPGTTCCVPGCMNNNLREKHLSFYVVPKDKELRRHWLRNIKRSGQKGKFSAFVPTATHRVCSSHFEGGRKTYMNNVPTVFACRRGKLPEVRKRKPPKKRYIDQELSLHGNELPLATDVISAPDSQQISEEHSYTSASDENNLHSALIGCDNVAESNGVSSLEQEPATADPTASELSVDDDEVLPNRSHEELLLELKAEKRRSMALEMQLRHKKAECTRLHATVAKLITDGVVMKSQNQFCFSKLSSNPTTFKFYTGASVDDFNALFKFLSADMPDFRYCGTKRKGQNNFMNRRKLLPKDELLLVLVKLRAGLLEDDLAYRFGVSQSTVSRICRTWLDLLYTKLHRAPELEGLNIRALGHFELCFGSASSGT